MQAIKLEGHVDKEHRIELHLPAEVPEGPVEVIVLMPDAKANQEVAQRLYLERFFRELDASDRQRLTKAEIDRYLDRERESWES